jgi:mannose-6-phosphate isomerase-like protein (cupin superfamily)
MEASDENYRAAPVLYPALQMVDLAFEASRAAGVYSNQVLSRCNDQCLRLAVMEGEYPWHVHPSSDELFLVMEGCLEIELSDGRTFRLTAWQSLTIPAGMEHRTRAIGRTVNLCFESLQAETRFSEEDGRIDRTK